MPTQTHLPFGDDADAPLPPKLPETLGDAMQPPAEELDASGADVVPEVEPVIEPVIEPMPELFAAPAEPEPAAESAPELFAAPVEPEPEVLEVPAETLAAVPAAGAVAAAAGAPRAAVNRPRSWSSRLLGALIRPFVSIQVEPAQLQEQLPEVREGAVCYVLEDYGLTNALILEQACESVGLPDPMRSLAGNPLGRKRAYVALSRRHADKFQPRGPAAGKTHSGSLARLIEAHRNDPTLDVKLVPVSIFVGRAPDRNAGWFSLLFSENWAMVGRFRRLMALALNGRDTLVRFSPPVRVRDLLNENLGQERTVRKLSRILRTHFRRIREAVIGPDLSTRRMLIDQVLAAPSVRDAIEDHARREKSSLEDAWKAANSMAYEIAADYSHSLVRSARVLLRPLWNRIYRGILVHHLDTVKQISPGKEVVYVPSHRSHMDYLLLSYLLYDNGIYPPHIVAGVNLNLPVVGTILRKGGAFFIRRSIRGSALYSAILSEYVAQLVSGGYSIECFIEGGRSRTGRLLQPKGGMISMVVRGFLRRPTRPMVFVPIYIGYEKLMEGNSYLDELSGKPKEKESIPQLLVGIPKVLRSNYGQVVVNFGEAIELDPILAQQAPDWDGKALDDEEKPEWLSRTVNLVAQRIQENVNRAADVNPINLLALALLSTPKHAMAESDLLNQIELYKTLLSRLPYSDRVTITPHSAAQIIEHGEEINVLRRQVHPMGDVLAVEDDAKAVLLSYFRNNTVHLFTAASWIACCFLNNRRMALDSIVRRGRSVYPFIQAELFLPWTEQEFENRLRSTIDIMIEIGLLEPDSDGDGVIARNTGVTDEVFRLRAIGHSLQQAFERYYIAISILAKNGPGTLTAGQLETMCHLAAQRLSLLYADTAPEFFDKSLFRGFIARLREMGLISNDTEGKLVFDDKLQAWAEDAKFILGRDLRHTIERISPPVVEGAVERETKAGPSA